MFALFIYKSDGIRRGWQRMTGITPRMRIRPPLALGLAVLILATASHARKGRDKKPRKDHSRFHGGPDGGGLIGAPIPGAIPGPHAGPGSGAGVIPGLGAVMHDVGEIGVFTEEAMDAIMAGRHRVAVKFDAPRDCKACKDLDKIWDMTAAAKPGTAWRVNCGDHPTVCVLRNVRFPAGGKHVILEPELQIWDGEFFYKYVGPQEATALIEWIVESIKG